MIDMEQLLEKTASEPEAVSRGRQRWRMPWATLLVLLLAFAGLLVVLYPSAAYWYSQFQQSMLIEQVDGVVAEGPADALAQEIDRARAYNETLVGGATVSSASRLPQADAQASGAFDYRSLLLATESGVMGRLKIPSISVELPIYHGTDDETLTRGVGHLEGTALPVGGPSTHSVLTAHRGLPSAELFNNLDRVRVGDTFTIEVFGEVLSYRVIDTRVVEPDQTESLFPQVGRDLVTLVTCTPLGINTHRILVTGERITPTPIADIENAGRSPEIPGFPWWAVGLAAGIAAIATYLWWAGRPTTAPGEPGTTNEGRSSVPDTDPGARGGPPLSALPPGGGAGAP